MTDRIICDTDHNFHRLYVRGVGWVAIHEQREDCVNPRPVPEVVGE